jgi:hypothetical protein
MDEFDALDVLDALEREVKESPLIPASSLRAVDRITLWNLLALARDELARGQQGTSLPLNWDEALAQAENERRFLLENARHEADELLREERIKVFTRQRFDAIVEQGQEEAQRVRQEANGYSAGRLAEAERSLEKLRQQVERALEGLKKDMKDSEKSHQQRKRDEAKQQKRMR